MGNSFLLSKIASEEEFFSIMQTFHLVYLKLQLWRTQRNVKKLINESFNLHEFYGHVTSMGELQCVHMNNKVVVERDNSYTSTSLLLKWKLVYINLRFMVITLCKDRLSLKNPGSSDTRTSQYDTVWYQWIDIKPGFWNSILYLWLNEQTTVYTYWYENVYKILLINKIHWRNQYF